MPKVCEDMFFVGTSLGKGITGSYFLQPLILAAFAAWATYKVRKAKKNPDNPYGPQNPTYLLLPIYRYVIWILCPLILISCILQIVIKVKLLDYENNLGNSIGIGLMYAIRQIAYEVVTFSFMSAGAGKRTYIRSFALAGMWSLVTLALKAASYYHVKSNPTVAIILELIWGGLLCLFYLCLALLPNNRLIARRPAVRPYSAFWAVAYIIFLASAGMREPELLSSYCVHIGFFYFAVLLWPYFVYKCFMDDSSYWQGAANMSVAANSIASVIQGGLNQSLAMDLVKADTFDVEFINFAALTIDQAPKQPKFKADDIIAEEQAHVLDGDDFEARLKTDNHFIIESGSMAKVYRGKYRGDAIAIKLIYAPELTTELIRNLFGEASIMSALRFSHVTGVKGVCVMPPAVSLVMELCQGSLHDLLHKPCVYDALFMYEQRLNRARRLRYGLPVTPYYSLNIQPHQDDTEYLSLSSMDPIESKRLISSYLENLTPEHETQLNAGLPAPYSAFTPMPILPPLPIEVQIRLAIDVVTGLAFMHTQRQPVMHLDVKSGNFLLGRDGVVKVADLELATRLPSQDAVLAPYLKEEKYHQCTEECMALIDAADCGLDEHHAALTQETLGDLLEEDEESSSEELVLTLPPKLSLPSQSPRQQQEPPKQEPQQPLIEQQHHISFVKGGQGGMEIKHRRFSNLVNKDPSNLEELKRDQSSLESSHDDEHEIDDLVLDLDDNIDMEQGRYNENSYTDSPTSRSRNSRVGNPRGTSRARREPSENDRDTPTGSPPGNTTSLNNSDSKNFQIDPDQLKLPTSLSNLDGSHLPHLSIDINDPASPTQDIKRRRKERKRSIPNLGLQTPLAPIEPLQPGLITPGAGQQIALPNQGFGDSSGVAIPGYPTSLGYPVLLPVKGMKPVLCPQRFSFHFRPCTNENTYTYETYPFYRVSDRRATILNPSHRVAINQEIASPLAGAVSDPSKLTLSHSSNYPKMMMHVHQDEQNQQMSYLHSSYPHLAAFTQPNRYHRPPLGYDNPSKHRRVLQRQRRKQQPFTTRQREQQREQQAQQEKARQEELQIVQRATTAFTLEPDPSTLRGTMSTMMEDSVTPAPRSTSRVGRGRDTDPGENKLRERSISRYRAQSRESDRTLYRYVVDGTDAQPTSTAQSTITTRANTRINVHSGTSSTAPGAPQTPTSASASGSHQPFIAPTPSLPRDRDTDNLSRLSTLAESASPPPGLEQLTLIDPSKQPEVILFDEVSPSQNILIATDDDDETVGATLKNQHPLPPPSTLPTFNTNPSNALVDRNPDPLAKDLAPAPELPLSHYAAAWAYTAHSTKAVENNLSRYSGELEISKVREFWVDICDQAVPLPRQHLGWGLKVAYGQLAHNVLYHMHQNFDKIIQYERQELDKKQRQTEMRLVRADSTHEEMTSPSTFAALTTPRRQRGNSTARIFFGAPEPKQSLPTFAQTPSLISTNSNNSTQTINETQPQNAIAGAPTSSVQDDAADTEFTGSPQDNNSQKQHKNNDRPPHAPSAQPQRGGFFSCLSNSQDQQPTPSSPVQRPGHSPGDDVDVHIQVDGAVSSLSNGTTTIPNAQSTMTNNSTDSNGVLTMYNEPSPSRFNFPACCSSQHQTFEPIRNPQLKPSTAPSSPQDGIELQPMSTITSNVTRVTSADSPSPLINLRPPGFNLFLTSHQSHSQSAAALLRKEKELEQRKNLSWFQRMKARWNQADLTNDEHDLEREVVVPQCLYWLAPEIIRHEPFGLAADVYSVACVLWEITTRQVPFREMEEIMEQEHRSEIEERKRLARERKKQIDSGATPTIPDPYLKYLTSPEEQLSEMIGYHHFRPTIPSHTHPAFAQIIRRCWHHDPSMRPSLVQVCLELRLLYNHLNLARGEHDWYGIEQTMMEAEVQGINLEDLQLDIDTSGPQCIFQYPAGHPMAIAREQSAATTLTSFPLIPPSTPLHSHFSPPSTPLAPQ